MSDGQGKKEINICQDKRKGFLTDGRNFPCITTRKRNQQMAINLPKIKEKHKLIYFAKILTLTFNIALLNKYAIKDKNNLQR